MPPIRDLDDIERRIDAGETVAAIASDLGVTPRTIRNRLHAAGRPLVRNRRSDMKRLRLADPDWLTDQYVTQCKGPAAIASMLSATTAEVVAALAASGIERPPSNPLLTAEALTEAISNGETVASIARSAGVQRQTVRRALGVHGLRNPNADQGKRPACLDDPGWLHQEYVTERQSIESIATRISVLPRTVHAALVRQGIEIRAGSTAHRVDDAWLRKRYTVDRTRLADIAAETGVSVSTIGRYLKRFGVPVRRPLLVASSHPHAGRPGGIDRDWLQRTYGDERLHVNEIASQAAVSASTVRRAVTLYGIRRTVATQPVASSD